MNQHTNPFDDEGAIPISEAKRRVFTLNTGNGHRKLNETFTYETAQGTVEIVSMLMCAGCGRVIHEPGGVKAACMVPGCHKPLCESCVQGGPAAHIFYDPMIAGCSFCLEHRPAPVHGDLLSGGVTIGMRILEEIDGRSPMPFRLVGNATQK